MLAICGKKSIARWINGPDYNFATFVETWSICGCPKYLLEEKIIVYRRPFLKTCELQKHEKYAITQLHPFQKARTQNYPLETDRSDIFNSHTV